MERHSIKRKGLVGFAALVLGLTLAGCGAAVEEAAEQALESEGQDVEIDEDGARITDEEGNETAIGSQAALPDGWPDDVSVPDGDIVYSTTMDGVMSVTVQVDGDLAATAEGIRGDLEAAGYGVESTTEAAEFRTFTFVKPAGADRDTATAVVSVTMANADDGTVTVNMTVEKS